MRPLSFAAMLLAVLFLGAPDTLAASNPGEDYRNWKVQAPKKVWVEAPYTVRTLQPLMDIEIPLGCYFPALIPNLLCRGNKDMEWSLEKEYWSIIAHEDSDQMARWLIKIESYLSHNRMSPNYGRLRILTIFGNLHVYSKKPNIFNILESPYVVAAFLSAKDSVARLPRSPNAWAFFWAIKNFTEFSLGLQSQGLESAQKMIDLGTEYGRDGVAGPVGAVAHLMGSANPETVRKGIENYDACFTAGICDAQTSIAPFQIVGTLITQAEGLAFLGEFEDMDRKLLQARLLAEEQHWPFLNRLDQIEEELKSPGGLIDQWQGRAAASGIRTPLGAGHRTSACAYCHVGNLVPEHYYIDY